MEKNPKRSLRDFREQELPLSQQKQVKGGIVVEDVNEV